MEKITRPIFKSNIGTSILNRAGNLDDPKRGRSLETQFEEIINKVADLLLTDRQIIVSVFARVLEVRIQYLKNSTRRFENVLPNHSFSLL